MNYTVKKKHIGAKVFLPKNGVNHTVTEDSAKVLEANGLKDMLSKKRGSNAETESSE
jgi:ribosomal protein S5